jgi:hypothetical protein
LIGGDSDGDGIVEVIGFAVKLQCFKRWGLKKNFESSTADNLESLGCSQK